MKVLALALALVLAASTAWAQAPTPAKPPAKPATPQKPAARPAQAPAKPGPKSPFLPAAFKVTVATEGRYPPFNYVDRKGLPAGFEMELAQEACQRMRAECEYTIVKWDELIPGLLDRKFDIIMSSLEVNNERRRRLGLSRRYYLSPGAFIAQKGAPYDGPPLLLRNKRIGVQKDSSHADYIDKSFRRSAQIKRFATVAEALKALTTDDVDAVFGDKAQLWLWSQKPEGKCCELAGQDIKLREALNKAFAEMMGDGTYKKLNEKYFPFALN